MVSTFLVGMSTLKGAPAHQAAGRTRVSTSLLRTSTLKASVVPGREAHVVVSTSLCGTSTLKQAIGVRANPGQGRLNVSGWGDRVEGSAPMRATRTLWGSTSLSGTSTLKGRCALQSHPPIGRSQRP